MPRIIYFTAGPTATSGELVDITNLNSIADKSFGVKVFNSQVPPVYGYGREEADFVAGTVPSLYSGIPVINTANIAGSIGIGGGGSTPLLEFAQNIRPALGALGRSSYERMVIDMIGHSVPWGVGAGGNSNTDLTAANVGRFNSWPAVMGKILSRGGTFGPGVEHMASGGAGNFVLGGTAALASGYGMAGVSGARVSIANSTTATITLAARGTVIRVYAYASTTGIQARYTVNGGSLTSAAASGSTATGHSAGSMWYEFNISGLTIGDTIVLSAPASGSYIFYAADLDYKTDAGVTVNRFCNPGMMAVQICGGFLDNTDTQGPAGWIGNGGDFAATRNANTDSMIVRPGGDLVIVETDINDLKGWATSGTAWGYTLADQIRHMNAFLAYCASKSKSVLIVGGPLRDPALTIADGVPYDQAALIAAYRTCAQNSTNAAFLDLTKVFANSTLSARYTLQQATGLIYDSVHPTKNGHAYSGAKVAQALLTALAT